MSGNSNPGGQGDTARTIRWVTAAMTALAGVNWNQTIYGPGGDKIHTFLYRKSTLSTIIL